MLQCVIAHPSSPALLHGRFLVSTLLALQSLRTYILQHFKCKMCYTCFPAFYIALTYFCAYISPTPFYSRPFKPCLSMNAHGHIEKAFQQVLDSCTVAHEDTKILLVKIYPCKGKVLFHVKPRRVHTCANFVVRICELNHLQQCTLHTQWVQNTREGCVCI